ncbi:MAG: tetrahydrofolate dehydrogenase/cyclohydrolase catalytic domain-containing protein [Patescibacteria group bacterium]
MSAKTLEGKAIATSILAELQLRIQRGRLAPALAVLAVETPTARHRADPFLAHTTRICEETGVACRLFSFPANRNTANFIQTIHELNADPNIQGIFLQAPLPQHLNTQKIIESIAPAKDVGGLHPHTARRILKMKPTLRDPRVEGVLRLIQVATRNHLLSEKFGVILSNDPAFRRVMAQTLYQALGVPAEAPRTLSPSARSVLQRADIVITAQTDLQNIRHLMIKDGAIVIDATIPETLESSPSRRLHPSLYAKAAWISHANTGLAPVRFALTLSNVLTAYSLAS